MAKEFVYYASVIYAALLNRSNALVYCRNGHSFSPSVVRVFFVLLEVCHMVGLLSDLKMYTHNIVLSLHTNLQFS